MDETILVTGGNGFLGRHIVARLLELNKRTLIFARKNKNDNISPPLTETVWGDIRDQNAVDQAVQKADIVIHLVSNFRKGGSDKKEAHAINVSGTENILNASKKYDIKHLIHCSTIGVHGTVLEVPANEDTPFNPGDLYQETKLEAENLVWDFFKETKLPTTVIRPISLMGPGDLRMLKLFKMIKNGKFVIVGDGETFFQPAYIDDVVDGFIACLNNENAIGESFIIGGDEYVTLNELFQIIAEQLGVNPPSIRVPLWPVLFLATLCETVCSPFGIEPPLHRRRVSFFQNNRAFSVEKAKKILGYKPKTSLKDAIEKTINWYTQEGWL